MSRLKENVAGGGTGSRRAMCIVIGGVAAVDGGEAPGPDQLVVTGKGGVKAGIAWITDANVIAGAERVGMVAAIATNVGKGGVEWVDAGVDDADDDAFTLGAGQAAGIDAVPDARCVNPARAVVSHQYALNVTLYRDDAGQVGDFHGFFGR